jgi:hypothetical protein
LERSNEQLDESEAQRENRTERFAIVDPWPGHLPPLAHGIYLPREGMGVVDRLENTTSSIMPTHHDCAYGLIVLNRLVFGPCVQQLTYAAMLRMFHQQ